MIKLFYIIHFIFSIQQKKITQSWTKVDVFVRVFSQPRDRFKLRNWKLTSNIPNPLQLIVVGAVVPPRLGAGAAHLALPALLRLQRARRPPPDGAGDGGRRAEGGDEDGRPRHGLGGRHHCQAAAAQTRGLRRRRSGRRFNAIACHIFSPFSIFNKTPVICQIQP